MIRNVNIKDGSASSASSLMEHLHLFWQWAWLILLAGIFAGGTAYLTSRNSTPVYQTTLRFLVSNPPFQSSIEPAGMISGTAMTQTYSQMVKDSPVLDGVIERLNLAMSAQRLVDAIQVQVVQNTQIISVSVEASSSSQAVEIANMLGVVFPERMAALQAERSNSTLQGLSKQVEELDRQIKETGDKIIKETDPFQKMQLDTHLAEYRKIYAGLVNRTEQVRLAEGLAGSSVAVIQPAQLPTAPVRPKTTQNTFLAILAGILVAFGAVYAVDSLDDTIANPEKIRQKFGLPILGIILRYNQLAGKPIAQDRPCSPAAESFRSLRTKVRNSSDDKPVRRLIITSPTHQEGKTTISANLGIVFAQGNKKVVLVDADLRCPEQHKNFALSNPIGLSEALVRPLEDLTQMVQFTGVPGLRLVPSGTPPPDPAELLESDRMAQLMDCLDEEYDLVILDTPPVLQVDDTASLASKVDGVILIAKPGVTRMDELRQSLDQLQWVGATILGVVLIDVDPKNRKYGYHYRQLR